MHELAKNDDSTKVVGVVGGQRDELVAYGHDAGGSVRAGWAVYGMVEAGDVLRCGCGLFSSVEEPVAELFPWFWGEFGRLLGEAV